jgi:glycolate oxidase FAD binding subunit
LQTAAVLGLSVVPRGAGRLQHWGDPPDSCDLIIDTRRLNRIIEHLPGDFKVTVQAGVRVSELEQVVEAARQTLAIPPPSAALPAVHVHIHGRTVM